MNKILTVDDDISISNILKKRLEKLDYKVFTADSGIKALCVLEKENIDIVLLDQEMPVMDGLETFDRILSKWPYTPVIMMTVHVSTHLAVEFMKAGGADFIHKTIDIDVMDVKIRKIIADARERKNMKEALVSYNRALEKTNMELKGLNLAKSNFISMMSHEFRTPLTVILGNIKTIIAEIDEMRPDVMKDFLMDADQQGEHLLLLINELMDITKIENGTFFLSEEEIDIVSIISGTVKGIKSFAGEKGITLYSEIDESAKIVLQGDPMRLKQVIINLLNNAVKFTKKGGSVSVRIDKDDNEVRVNVTDTGMGIPEGKIKHIFDRFYQADNNTTRKYGGMGLGLNIVKQIVELHKGRIEVESEEGKGSVFSFFLPV